MEFGASQQKEKKELISKKKAQEELRIGKEEAKKQPIPKQNETPMWKLKLIDVLDGVYFSTIMTIITLYALFGDDIRVLVTDKNGDSTFWIFNIIALCAFGIEVLLASLCKEGYFNGFFFWLDFISTLSILLDIGWVTTQLFSTSSSSGAGATSAAQLARAGRASRVGTKAGRIVRIVRLIRLVKLYKQAQSSLAKEAENLEKMEQELNKDQQTKIASKSTKLLQKSVKKLTLLKKTIKIHNHDENIKVIDENQTGSSQVQLNKLSYINQKLPPIQQKRQVVSQQIITQDVSDELRDTSKQVLKDVHDQPINSNINSNQLESPRQVKDEAPVFVETKVGAKLSDLTTRRVIVLVMSIMFSIPIFTVDTYYDPVVSFDTGLGYVQIFENSSDIIMQEALDVFVQYHKDIRTPIVYTEFYTDNKTCCKYYPSKTLSYTNVDYKSLRDEDQNLFTFNDLNGSTVAFSIINIQINQQLNAILSIVRTIFVSIVLGGGAMLFSNDVEILIVSPIEKMLEKVKRISQNPLSAAQMEEQEALAMDEVMKNGLAEDIAAKKEEEQFETSILEKLIIKTGALLALGFGEAGAEIIAENMNKGGEVDPMLPGKKIIAIFGFCDIRNFNDVTEVLQTGVMLFVNKIAEIVHATVDQFCGQSNKNIGEAFLLVWKFSEDQCIRKSGGQVTLKIDQKVKELSDLPVLSFIRVIVGTNMSFKLQEYKKNKQLNDRMPNYKVDMGFGLHTGWGIEGAIGSNFKIDASYLSPNVNMSSRLEAATRQFGTQLLISGPLYKLLTPKCQRNLRHIDTVTVKGSLVPLEFWTPDICVDRMMIVCKRVDKFDVSRLTNEQQKKRRVLHRLKRNKLKEDIIKGVVHISDLFETDREIASMRQIFTKQFYEQWEIGFKAYIEGDWEKALQIFTVTHTLLNNYNDGPSKTLIEVIKTNDGKPPKDWAGFRILTEK